MTLIIRVLCPYCGKEQNTRSVKRVKCLRCEKSYKIYPKDKKSHVVKLVKGTLIELHSELYKQKIFG